MKTRPLKLERVDLVNGKRYILIETGVIAKQLQRTGSHKKQNKNNPPQQKHTPNKKNPTKTTHPPPPPPKKKVYCLPLRAS